MKSVSIKNFDTLDYATNEALNTLVTNLSFAGTDVRVIMLTSCQLQEGKSFLSMNLMRTLANVGKRVVLVDADLRKSVLMARYGISAPANAMGLSHYLANMCTINDVVYSTNIAGAYLVPVGQDVVNSLMLLNKARLSSLLKGLASSFEVVLVDAPPVGIIIDAAEIAKSCDGVLFVVSSNNVTRRELVDATRQIQKTGCPILGAVLNKVTFDTHSSKKYYHKAYYANYSNDAYKTGPRQRKKKQAPVFGAGSSRTRKKT